MPEKSLQDNFDLSGEATYINSEPIMSPGFQLASDQLVDDRYRLIGALGQGAFGAVWLALDRRLERQVAIKFLRHVQAEDIVGSLSWQRFLQESKAIAALNHPNIVQVFDASLDGQTPFIVMEYISGLSLQKHLQENGALALPEALRLFKDIATGVAYSHERKIIHRDLKPANILLAEPQGQLIPKIVDFGLARIDSEIEQQITISGYGMGTEGYMPLEQRRDAKTADHRADIYALGKIFYVMLSGDAPNDVKPNKIPDYDLLRKIIYKCIETKPEDRYSGVEELLSVLEKFPAGVSKLSSEVKVADKQPCPSCQAVNETAAKFCQFCGTSLKEVCSGCGHEISGSAVYCAMCCEFCKIM